MRNTRFPDIFGVHFVHKVLEEDSMGKMLNEHTK